MCHLIKIFRKGANLTASMNSSFLNILVALFFVSLFTSVSSSDPDLVEHKDSEKACTNSNFRFDLIFGDILNSISSIFEAGNDLIMASMEFNKVPKSLLDINQYVISATDRSEILGIESLEAAYRAVNRPFKFPVFQSKLSRVQYLLMELNDFKDCDLLLMTVLMHILSQYHELGEKDSLKIHYHGMEQALIRFGDRRAIIYHNKLEGEHSLSLDVILDYWPEHRCRQFFEGISKSDADLLVKYQNGDKLRTYFIEYNVHPQYWHFITPFSHVLRIFAY
jgi:hypothetical protein